MAETKSPFKTRPRDEYGFIILTTEEKHLRSLRIFNTVCQTSGRGSMPCKGLCEGMPKVDGRRVYLNKSDLPKTVSNRFSYWTGYYWCSGCGIIMKCARCHCCSRVGRSRPRRGKRLSRATKFVE